MVKFLKPGKIVIVLAGRFAGRKALIVKNFDEGTKEHPYGHALIAGIERYPQKVTKSMSKSKILKRSKVKPFIKAVNYNHLMPTRYTISDLDLKTAVATDKLKKAEGRSETKKNVKKVFQDRYINRGKNSAAVSYFYSKLRF